MRVKGLYRERIAPFRLHGFMAKRSFACCSNVPPLPGLTPNGRRVIIMRGVDLDQIAASVSDGMKVVLMIGDIRLKEEHIGVAGDVYILDASVATPQNFATHFAKFTPSLIKKFLICVQVGRNAFTPAGFGRRRAA